MGTFAVDAKLSGAVPIMDTLMGTLMDTLMGTSLRSFAHPTSSLPVGACSDPPYTVFSVSSVYFVDVFCPVMVAGSRR